MSTLSTFDPVRPVAMRRPLPATGGGAWLALVPAGLLLAGFWKTRELDGVRLVLGWSTVLQLLVLLLLAARRPSEPRSRRSALYALYLSAWACLWMVPRVADWFVDLTQGICLLVPLGLFAGQMIEDSGAAGCRRARRWAERLRARQEWPADVLEFARLPEVVGLREAIARSATPAFELLEAENVNVQLAALAALEDRSDWEPGQPQCVLALARHTPDASVRAAALRVLAAIDDRYLVMSAAEFLRDPATFVRQAATEVVFRDRERRWPWVRDIVHTTLGDERLANDAALVPADGSLPGAMLEDLHSWTSEKGLVATRAAHTLAAYYASALAADTAGKLAVELRRRVVDAQTPGVWRMELAQLLARRNLLDTAVQEKLLDPDNAAPLRLLAADALLAGGEHAGALQALRELGRLPNRELGLATADVLRRRLGLDLGLTPGQAPPLQSRQAAMITRRVMAWAADEELPDQMTSTMLRF